MSKKIAALFGVTLFCALLLAGFLLFQNLRKSRPLTKKIAPSTKTTSLSQKTSQKISNFYDVYGTIEKVSLTTKNDSYLIVQEAKTKKVIKIYFSPKTTITKISFVPLKGDKILKAEETKASLNDLKKGLTIDAITRTNVTNSSQCRAEKIKISS